MRNRYRWINKRTGLPGWIKPSFYPGWRSSNLSNTGFYSRYFRRISNPPYPQTAKNINQDQTALSPDQDTILPGFSSIYDPWGIAVLTPEEELNFMKVEAEQLEDQLYAIEKRIKELEEKE